MYGRNDNRQLHIVLSSRQKTHTETDNCLLGNFYMLMMG